MCIARFEFTAFLDSIFLKRFIGKNQVLLKYFERTIPE